MKLCAGPENGSLLLIGGGSKGFTKKFMELAGGANAKIVIVPTALSSGEIKKETLAKFKKRFLDAGFKNVKILHTRSRKEANSKKFIRPILDASGIWFSGGRQWRHADSYLNTLTHDAFRDLLDRGGVIAGTSAGASIQGSFLVRGDTKTNTIMMGDHKEGLGFFQNVAIDQHLLARNRQFDLFEILEKRPELLGLGIDENTAIVVKGDAFRVIGESYVAVYDGTRWCAERNSITKLAKGSREFYYLNAGKEYNLRKRRLVHFGDRKFLDFSKERMSKYVGKYFKKGSDLCFEISIEKKSIVLSNWISDEQSIVYQETEKHFYVKDSNLSMEFNLYKNGKVEGFNLLPENTFWRKKR